MVTNTKEYQREYQKEYRRSHPQKQYKKKVKNWEVKKESKELKKENKMLEISLERLKRPAKVGIPVLETYEGKPRVEAPSTKIPLDSGSKALAIDFSYLANNSSFQRGIMEFMKKYAPGLENIKVRGNKEILKQSFNENANNYREVMCELKIILKEREKDE